MSVRQRDMAAAERAGKMLDSKARALLSCPALLPDTLGREEMDIAVMALGEAAGILRDAAQRVQTPLPSLWEDED